MLGFIADAAGAESMNTTARAWSRSLSTPAAEFPSTPLSIREGRLPPGLRGTLYRNGPARFERGGLRVAHWFDGDGAILAVRFTDAGASAVYRYVRTEGLLREARAGRLLYGNYGMTAPGPIWNQWRRPLKNTANTAVLALPDRLLALWEARRPHALDPETLETRSLDDLAGPGGRLHGIMPFSAHPKRDPKSGDIYNFGVWIGGPNATLKLYRCDARGRLQQRGECPLEGIPLLHDFVLAGRYLVFAVPPVRISPMPVLLGVASFSEAMQWRPELGTTILVVDRETLRLVARHETDAWFQWHFGNGGGATDGRGTLMLDLARYPDFATNRHLAEVASGRTQTPAKATLWRMLLDPIAGIRALEEVSARSIEFPVVAAADVGRPWRHTFAAMHRADSDPALERYDALARIDIETGELTEADLGGDCYPTEPVIVADREGVRRWLLTVVYDGRADASEVRVLDADRLDAGPVCVLPLPSTVPLGFHGTWRPA
jgi:carotenoid cleavage dioxygenase-like enzyme